MVYPAVGAISGAALGYIHGGVKGAYIGGRLGYEAGKRKAGVAYGGILPKKSKMAPIKKKSTVLRVRSQNPINKLANRASMSMKGKKNQKVKSTKKVKVSRSLREKVNKVIAGHDAYGAYYKFYSGAIGIVDTGTGAGATQTNLAVGRDTTGIVSSFPAGGFPCGNQYWWGALHQSVTATGLVPLGVSQAFTYFGPEKILDAASVLFNRKVAANDWSIVTGNLSTNTTITTGQYIAGSSSFPVAGTLKVRVINSYVQWRMKNTSQRTLYVKIYNCVPKLKFAQQMPLTTIASPGTLSNPGNVDATYLSANSGNQQLAITTHPCFKPTQYRPFNSTYKASCMTMVINPGEECVHNIQGPKNYTLDYGKLYPQGATEIGSFYKDTTVNCMVSVMVDSVAFSGSTSGTAPLVFTSGSTVPLLVDPLDITVCEVIKVACPEIAGFITTAGAAGSQQQLNQRKEKVVYYNLNQTSTSGDVYVAFNEENPGANVTRSVTN